MGHVAVRKMQGHPRYCFRTRYSIGCLLCSFLLISIPHY